MCGILGGLWFAQTTSQVEQKLSAGLQIMRYRGPDDQGVSLIPVDGGVVAFGHLRLSILDLTAAGHQPMFSPDRRYSIVFNGEIYNYKELRDELINLGHVFISESDTEVLLAAWISWGQQCLPRFTGMFAFAVFDHRAGTITCVRDAFGIKPFYFSATRNNFVFASELPALKALLEGKPKLDWQQAYNYLVHGDYDSSSRTFFEGVSHLMPGHLLVVDLRERHAGKPQRWWQPSIAERNEISFASAADMVREQFLDDIRVHLRSDVAVGAALSGGVDSSAVVCAMRHVEPDIPIHTFSYIAKESDVNEENWVDLVNQHVRAISHKVSVNPTELFNDLDSMISVQGEPFGSTSIYAQFRVFQLAKEAGVTVTLDGQGADEMLAGYNGYPGQRLHSMIDLNRFSDASRFLGQWAQWPGRSKWLGLKHLAAEMSGDLTYQMLRKMNGYNPLPKWINAEPLLECGVICRFPRVQVEKPIRGRRVVSALAEALTLRGLPALLRHGDRNSMRFSVESRVPFLTLNMVNLLLSLPESYLISDSGETKHVFREAMRGIVPSEILGRRDKIGFATPEQQWLLSTADTVRTWLKEDLNLPFLNHNLILQEFELIVAGRKAFSWQVWRWINFYRWYLIFLK